MFHLLLYKLTAWMVLGLPSFLSFAFVYLGKPCNPALRFIFAVLLGWVATVVFVALVYNPIGIMTAEARGIPVEHAGMRYDNNTTSIALLVGWIPPLTSAFFAFATCFLISFWKTLSGPDDN